MLFFNEDGWLVCFDTPGDRLFLDRAEPSGRERLRCLSVLLGESRHFAHLHDDFGERQSAKLLACDSRLNGESESIHEFKESLVVARDEIAGSAGNRSGGVFQLCAVAERKASPVAPGYRPVIEADRKCGLVGTSRR